MKEITEIVDPRDLPSGHYYASSLTDGYGALLAMVASGDAHFLGENIQPEGVKLVAIRKGKAANPPERTIGISREFFTTVLKDYEDWKLKWWREAIQNSVDAGATKIDCTVFYNEDGTVTCSVEDDGGGMDEDILLNKFLMLGGSTKKLGSGAAGGFGKAKELLILPWLSWRIHTRDRIIEGSGISYTVHPAPYLNGTSISATMPADQYTYEAPAQTFIQRCYLPDIRFSITKTKDGETEKFYPKARLKSEELIDEAEGKVEVYVAPVNYDANRLYIRVNGLFMFDKWINTIPDKQLIVEIIAPSIEILTANRDGFRDWETRKMIDGLVERISKDVLSGLRAKKGLIRKKYLGTGKFKAKQLESDVLAEMGSIEQSDDGVTSISEYSVQQIGNILAEYDQPNLPDKKLALELLSSVDFTGAFHIEEAVKQLVWEPDFFIINEVEGFKVPAKFLPETMKPQIVKLIRTWTELCRFVLMQLGNYRPYGVGFIFTDNTHAAYLEESQTERWLMLNPFVNPKRRAKTWTPSNMEDLKKLYAFAIHECTHLSDGIDYHDESFASALTNNIAKTGEGFRKLRKIANAVKIIDQPLVDVLSSNPQLKSKLLR